MNDQLVVHTTGRGFVEITGHGFSSSGMIKYSFMTFLRAASSSFVHGAASSGVPAYATRLGWSATVRSGRKTPEVLESLAVRDMVVGGGGTVCEQLCPLSDASCGWLARRSPCTRACIAAHRASLAGDVVSRQRCARLGTGGAAP